MKSAYQGISLIFLLFIIASSSGCYYDNEETLYPNGICDTADVKYSQQISYILSTKCYDCHDNANAPLSGNGVSFEGYSNISGYLDFSSSVFLSAIKHQPPFVPMPKDRPKLSECDIRTIEIWIQAGYPDN